MVLRSSRLKRLNLVCHVYVDSIPLVEHVGTPASCSLPSCRQAASAEQPVQLQRIQPGCLREAGLSLERLPFRVVVS